MVSGQRDPDRVAPASDASESDRAGNSPLLDGMVASTLTPANPLAVIVNASGREAVTAGSDFHLSVTIHNKGGQSAIVRIFLDDRATVLKDWCESLEEFLALGSEQSGEVIFTIHVPADAVPMVYPYLVSVDARDYYPNHALIKLPQRIQVLPSSQDVVQSNDPTFILQPVTSPDQPAIIQPGGAAQFQIIVHNRSDRVDRFRLACTDLPREWIRVSYPQGIQGAGLVLEADSLNLNPGEQGLISLVINPPLDTAAGIYIPTLRLYSVNHPELLLLDLVYLTVPPIYLLQAELRTIISRVRRQAGLYQIRLHNTGNTPREVFLRMTNLDEEALCDYFLDRLLVQLAPREVAGIGLRVQPKKWWKRPIYGGGRVLNFSVDLEDSQKLPLTIDNLPGFLVWEARPWWQVLPLLLLVILSLVAIGYGIWWLLIRIPPAPKLVQFAAEDLTYNAINDDSVRLGWQISDANRLQSIKITGLAPDGKPLTQPEVYDFRQGVPAPLQPFCTWQQALLDCRQVTTNARKPGTYMFEMVLTPKPQRGATQEIGKSKPVTITPIPLPTIVAFTSTQPVYQEPIAPPQPVSTATPKPQATPAPPPAIVDIRLNWAIAHPNQLREIQLIGRSPDGVVVSPLQKYTLESDGTLPAPLRKLCELKEQLICQNVPTGAQQPGDYLFELTALPRTGIDGKPMTLKTALIKILPKPPRILEFKLNGQPALPKYLIPLTVNQPLPKLLLAWRVDTSAGSKVELLPAPGSVPLEAKVPLVLSPKPGNVTVTLQVTSPNGQQVVRSMTLETFDPTDPATATAAAVAKAIAEAQATQKAEQEAAAKQGANGAGGLNAPTPSEPGTLSPIELPPQIDRK